MKNGNKNDSAEQQIPCRDTRSSGSKHLTRETVGIKLTSRNGLPKTAKPFPKNYETISQKLRNYFPKTTKLFPQNCETVSPELQIAPLPSSVDRARHKLRAAIRGASPSRLKSALGRANRQSRPQPPLTNQNRNQFISTATTTASHDTGQHTASRSTTSPTNNPTTQLEQSAAQRLRTTMAAVRLAYTWLGVRKTLAPEQRTTAARAFHADRELLSAGRHQLDRGQDQVVLQAGVAARCPARSGRTDRGPCGCHCRRQDRGVTPVGLGKMFVGGSGGVVFAVRSRCRKGAETRAG